MTLKNWKARRSGGAITITGYEAGTGIEVRVPGVVEITPGKIERKGLFGRRADFHCTAISAHGDSVTLLVD